MSDHYQTLGVARNATPSEIETAYRVVCEKYHPEKHTDNALRELAEEKIRMAEVAYSTLRDTRLRARYDREIGLRPDRDAERGGTSSTAMKSILTQVLKGVLIKFLWLGLGYFYARLVKFNWKVILFTLAALFLVWAFRKYRKS